MTMCRFKIGIVAQFLILAGCSQEGSFQKAQSIQDDNSTQKLYQVCYIADPSCVDTTPIENLVDKHQHYTYQNESEYPNESLSPQYQVPKRLIDLEAFDTTYPISPHFLFMDFASPAKGRYGIIQRHLVETLQSLRGLINTQLTITSSYRNPHYNRKVGGSTWSRHMYGDAVDMYSENLSLEELKTQCEMHNASFILVYETHIHCDWRVEPLDPGFYDVEESLPIRTEVPKINAQIATVKSNKNFKTYSIQGFEPEDPGVLVYEWIVQTPDKKTLYFDTADIRLPRIDGVYHTVVTVGRTIRIEQDL